MVGTMNRIIISLLIVLFGSVLVSADGVDDQDNPNDPTINDRANACYEDGTMAGKCQTNWEWACGWYLMQFEYDLISRDEFPSWCISIIPEEIGINNTILVDTIVCADVGPGWVIFPNSRYLPTGIVPTYSDNTCNTLFSQVWFLAPHVVASNLTDATNLCIANGHISAGTPVGDIFPCFD